MARFVRHSEDIGILQGLLREVGLERRQRGGEIRDRLAGAGVGALRDLDGEDRAAPAVRDGGLCVPESVGARFKFIQEHELVSPRQRSQRLGRAGV
jgi:hypothetical protein